MIASLHQPEYSITWWHWTWDSDEKIVYVHTLQYRARRFPMPDVPGQVKPLVGQLKVTKYWPDGASVFPGNWNVATWAIISAPRAHQLKYREIMFHNQNYNFIPLTSYSFVHINVNYDFVSTSCVISFDKSSPFCQSALRLLYSIFDCGQHFSPWRFNFIVDSKWWTVNVAFQMVLRDLLILH